MSNLPLIPGRSHRVQAGGGALRSRGRAEAAGQGLPCTSGAASGRACLDVGARISPSGCTGTDQVGWRVGGEGGKLWRFLLVLHCFRSLVCSLSQTGEGQLGLYQPHSLVPLKHT